MGICRSWSSWIVWYYSCSFQEKEIIEFKGPAQAGLLFYAIFDILCLKEIKSMFSGTSSMVTIMDFIPLGIILYLCFMDSSYLNYYFSNIKNVILVLCLIGCCLIGSFINHHKLQKIMKGV